MCLYVSKCYLKVDSLVVGLTSLYGTDDITAMDHQEDRAVCAQLRVSHRC